MRKKKLRLLAVLLAASMLCSCSAPVYPRSTDEPQLQFYYCTGEGADTGIGALAARPVSVPDERPDAVLQQYLTAPAGKASPSRTGSAAAAPLIPARTAR